MNPPYIIKKASNGYKILELTINDCYSDIPCEKCNERKCELPQNIFYAGFLVTPTKIEQYTELYDDVKPAYVLSEEDAGFIFRTIEKLHESSIETIYGILKLQYNSCRLLSKYLRITDDEEYMDYNK